MILGFVDCIWNWTCVTGSLINSHEGIALQGWQQVQLGGHCCLDCAQNPFTGAPGLGEETQQGRVKAVILPNTTAQRSLFLMLARSSAIGTKPPTSQR